MIRARPSGSRLAPCSSPGREVGRVPLLACAMLTLVAAPAIGDMPRISITARSDAPVALPPDAALEVRLLDVSRADAPSTDIAVRRLEVTALPIALELPYDPVMIDGRMSYVVAARILSGERVLFRTTTAYPVLTRGAPEAVAIVLEPMAH